MVSSPVSVDGTSAMEFTITSNYSTSHLGCSYSWPISTCAVVVGRGDYGCGDAAWIKRQETADLAMRTFLTGSPSLFVRRQ